MPPSRHTAPGPDLFPTGRLAPSGCPCDRAGSAPLGPLPLGTGTTFHAAATDLSRPSVGVEDEALRAGSREVRARRPINGLLKCSTPSFQPLRPGGYARQRDRSRLQARDARARVRNARPDRQAVGKAGSTAAARNTPIPGGRADAVASGTNSPGVCRAVLTRPAAAPGEHRGARLARRSRSGRRGRSRSRRPQDGSCPVRR